MGRNLITNHLCRILICGYVLSATVVSKATPSPNDDKALDLAMKALLINDVKASLPKRYFEKANNERFIQASIVNNEFDEQNYFCSTKSVALLSHNQQDFIQLIKDGSFMYQWVLTNKTGNWVASKTGEDTPYFDYCFEQGHCVSSLSSEAFFSKVGTKFRAIKAETLFNPKQQEYKAFDLYFRGDCTSF